jgi:transcription initiation factor IIE alpha subunit
MQPDGQTIDDLSTELGWLQHTTRAVISRLQTSGHVVTRTKGDDGQSVYRIEAPAVSDQDA